MTARPHPAWTSPALLAEPAGQTPAYETKFLVPPSVAAEVEAWAAGHLVRDPHGDPARDHRYQVTSLYFDTPTFDVCLRTDGFRRHKHRVRRYGADPVVHLERKSKRDGQVWKVRTPLPVAGLTRLADGSAPEPAAWFVQQLAERGLRPVCRISYDRTAFVGAGPAGPIRLTLDRSAVGAQTTDPVSDPVTDGVPLLTDGVILELKYLTVMPTVFKDVIERHRLAPATVSKYRRFAAAAGLVPEGSDDV